jgi:hypothetical protein
MSQKRIQISSNFTSEADQFFERIEDDKGNVKKVIQNQEPKVTTSSTTITTNPYTAKTDGSPENTRTKEGAATTVKIDKPGYDTSQL